MLGFGVRQETTTTGTGNLTLTSVSGYPTFNNVFGLDRRFSYSILDSERKPIEHGIGYLSASTTLVRERVLATFVSGVYDDTAPATASLASGTKLVIGSAGFSTLVAGTPRFATGYGSGTGIRSIVAEIGGDYWADTTTPAQDFLLISVFWLPSGGESSGIRIRVTTAEASKNAKVAIYETASDGWAGKRIAQTGNISLGTTGEKSASWDSGNVFLTPGWYYLATTVDSSTAALAAQNASNLWVVSHGPLGQTGTSGSSGNRRGYKAITTTLTMPDPMEAESAFTVDGGTSSLIKVLLEFV